jgi:hypothetical protein
MRRDERQQKPTRVPRAAAERTTGSGDGKQRRRSTRGRALAGEGEMVSGALRPSCR